MDEDNAGRWQFLTKDINADGQLTLSDVGLWCYHGFFAPGDYILSTLISGAPAVAKFLELSPVDYQGVLSGFLSAVIWIGSVLSIGVGYGIVRNLDRVLTSYIRRVYRETLRGARIIRTWTACRVHGLKDRMRLVRPDMSQEVELEELALNQLEVAVLRFSAELSPGYLVTASDIAAALGIRASQTQQTLDKLKELHLVASAFGTNDDEDGYRSTRLGKLVLMSLSPTAAA